MHLFTSSSLLDLLAGQVNVQPKFIPFLFLCTKNIPRWIYTNVW